MQSRCAYNLAMNENEHLEISGNHRSEGRTGGQGDGNQKDDGEKRCARTLANRKKGESYAASGRARCGIYYSKNRAAILEKKKSDRKANPEKFRKWRLASKLMESYGLTVAQYRTMEAAQGGVCAICKKPEQYTRNGKPRRLTVDHCHATGKIRGLLCGGCNAALGMMKDNAENLKRGAEYLAGFSRDGETRAMESEAEVFAFVGLPYAQPEERR